MADVQPFRALHYDLDAAGGLQALAAPPYDVIDDAAARRSCVARSPHNVVEIDLPRADGDPYAHAAEVFARVAARRGARARRAAGDLGARAGLHRPRRACGGPATGCSRASGSRTTDRARVRPHERTHPGPKEDRLRLTRATKANLSPIFSLYDDPSGAAWGAVAPHVEGVAVGRGDRRGRHGAPALARRRPRRGRRRHRRAGGRRAADRRRPPPLRDGARVRAGGRREPRADVPRRAPGPGLDRVPHAPPARRARPGQARGAAGRDRARLGGRPDRRRRSSSRWATDRSGWATTTRTTGGR